MLVCEGSEVVDIFVDDNVEVVWLVVCRDVSLGECFGHLGCAVVVVLYSLCLTRGMKGGKQKSSSLVGEGSESIKREEEQEK